MKLSIPSAPSFGIFVSSIVLAILVYLDYFGIVSVPLLGDHSFLILSIAYIVLLLGTIIRRL